MNATKALKTYFTQGPGEPLTAKELIAFKNATDAAEYQELGRQACEALGEPYDAPEA